MCVNNRYIRNCYGEKILVKCGHCSACLQEKAIARTNRIKNEIGVDTIALFVTLTYTNDSVPYIRYSDIVDQNNLYNTRCCIYRDSSPRYERVNGDYHTQLVPHYGTVVLKDDVQLPFGKCRCTDKFIALHGQKDFDKIGVCYFPDVQNFIKKLKVNLYRSYGLSNTFSYFCCTEYGPSSQRPHIHLVFYCKKDSFSLSKYKVAITKSWSFSDLRKLPRSIEIAVDVAGYIASYVNCSDTIPSLFQSCSEFKQKHSYSHSFGMANSAFSLENISKAYDKRTLKYSVSKVRDGVFVTDSLLLPKYVISRYFPKHKGFNRLTTNEIQRIVLRPQSIYEYSETLGIDLKQCYQIEVQYRNRLSYALSHGLNRFDFARMYSDIWSLRALSVLKDMYNNVQNLNDYFTLYDNINELFNGDVLSPTLFNLIDNTTDIDLINCNNFPQRVAKTLKLEDCYHKYNKNRKIRNYILSKNVYI